MNCYMAGCPLKFRHTGVQVQPPSLCIVSRILPALNVVFGCRLTTATMSHRQCQVGEIGRSKWVMPLAKRMNCGRRRSYKPAGVPRNHVVSVIAPPWTDSQAIIALDRAAPYLDLRISH